METEQTVPSLPEESLQERASREMAELREQYPDAELNPGQMKTLAETVSKEPGISLAQAYGRWLLDDKDRADRRPAAAGAGPGTEPEKSALRPRQSGR